MIVLDTNVLIYYFQDKPKVVSQLNAWRKKRIKFLISSISEVEILAYPKITKVEINKIKRFLRAELESIPLGSILAHKAAEFKRKYKTKIADSIIAAVAYKTKSTLATRNIKDFQKIKEINLVKI